MTIKPVKTGQEISRNFSQPFSVYVVELQRNKLQNEREAIGHLPLFSSRKNALVTHSCIIPLLIQNPLETKLQIDLDLTRSQSQPTHQRTNERIHPCNPSRSFEIVQI